MALNEKIISFKLINNRSSKHLGVHLTVGLVVVAIAHHVVLADQALQALHVRGAEVHIQCAQVVWQMCQLCGAGDGHDVGRFVQQPGNGQLRRAAIEFFGHGQKRR